MFFEKKKKKMMIKKQLTCFNIFKEIQIMFFVNFALKK